MAPMYAEPRLRPLDELFLHTACPSLELQDRPDVVGADATWALTKHFPSLLRRRHSIGGYVPYALASLESPRPELSSSRSRPSSTDPVEQGAGAVDSSEEWPGSDNKLEVAAVAPALFPAMAPACTAGRSAGAAGPAGHAGSEAGHELPTTMIVRNLSSTVSQTAVQQALDRTGFEGWYDFVFVPEPQGLRSRKTCAIVNLVSAPAAAAFRDAWHDSQQLPAGPRLLKVSPAAVQGLDANVRKWSRRVRMQDQRSGATGADGAAGTEGSAMGSSSPGAAGQLLLREFGPALACSGQGSPQTQASTAAASPPTPAHDPRPSGSHDSPCVAAAPPAVAAPTPAADACGTTTATVQGQQSRRGPSPGSGSTSSTHSPPATSPVLWSPVSHPAERHWDSPVHLSLDASPLPTTPTVSTSVSRSASTHDDTPPRPHAAPAKQTGWQGVTTLMVRNLRKDLSQDVLLEVLDAEGFAGMYDFVYMPCDFDLHERKGYAFVNFSTVEAAIAFAGAFQKAQHKRIAAGGAPLTVSPAALQGLRANLQKWAGPRLSRVRNPALRPFVRGPQPTRSPAGAPPAAPPSTTPVPPRRGLVLERRRCVCALDPVAMLDI